VKEYRAKYHDLAEELYWMQHRQLPEGWDREQVATAAGVPDAAETVCLLLEHLAANGRALSSGAGDPEQLRFSRV
jgi:hypothetical protein